jgi:hypothetical protein
LPQARAWPSLLARLTVLKQQARRKHPQKFKPSVSQERMDAILKECGAERIAMIKGMGVHHIRIVNKETVERVVTRLSAFQEVEYAEPNLLSQTEQ